MRSKKATRGFEVAKARLWASLYAVDKKPSERDMI
jgi:hypothetical protein